MQLFSREYYVAIAKRTGSEIKKLNFIRIPNGRGFWVADPFPIEIDGVLYIFGEVYEYCKDKGSIGYTKFENNTFSPWKIIIEESYHMSFPYLFYENDTLYMCPETSQSNRVYLYRCESFPDKWKKDRELIDGVNFSDTIFYKNDGIVYGFTCLWNSINDHQFKIFRFNDDGYEVSKGRVETLDYYLTRPAGKILYDKRTGKQIMVSQICKPLYGSGLIFKEFDLEWPDYSEKELFRILPNDINCDIKDNYIGLHTFNVTENYVVIDLIRSRFSVYEKICHLRKLKEIVVNKNSKNKDYRICAI